MSYETAVRALRDIVYHEAVRKPRLKKLTADVLAEKGGASLDMPSLIVVSGALGTGHTFAVQKALAGYTAPTIYSAELAYPGEVIGSLQEPKSSKMKRALIIDCFPHATKLEQKAIDDMMTLPGAENIVFVVITGPDREFQTGGILNHFYTAEFHHIAMEITDR